MYVVGVVSMAVVGNNFEICIPVCVPIDNCNNDVKSTRNN